MMMLLKLVRDTFAEDCTLGKLFVDGKFECYVCEDKDRHIEDGEQKIYGKTAIPRGSYKVVIDRSTRFQRDLPRLLDVPQFEGIRIHSGNTSKDTEGCLLPGVDKLASGVGQSRVAFNRLFNKLKKAYAIKEEIVIVIK